MPKPVLRYVLDKSQYFDLEQPLPNLVSQITKQVYNLFQDLWNKLL